MYYFALFLPVQEGGYAVEFPDIPEAFTQGSTLEECMDMARDVLSIAVEEYAKAKKTASVSLAAGQSARGGGRGHAGIGYGFVPRAFDATVPGPGNRHDARQTQHQHDASSPGRH